MALPATDDFDSAVNTALETHNASWTVVTGGFECRGGSELSGDGASDHMAAWNADTFDDAQYCQTTFGNLNATDGELIGPALRCSTTQFTCYGIFASNAVVYFSLYNNGSETPLSGAGYAGIGDGDAIRLEAEGSTLRYYVDTGSGFPGTADETETNGTLTSGAGGLLGFEQNTPRIADWEAGNLGGGGGVTVPIFYHHYRMMKHR